MTILATLWLFSLAALLGIFLYARNAPQLTVTAGEEPESLSDLIAIELTRMSGHLSRMGEHARPHGERALAHSATLLKKGHDIFTEKIFGRIAVEKGKAASFFLKRIAEHKEALRQKDREGE